MTAEQRRLAEGNIKLVYSLVNGKYGRFHSEDREDIISVAMGGLCHAAVTYQKEKTRFSTWAYRLMEQAIGDHLQRRIKHGFWYAPKTGVDAPVSIDHGNPETCLRHTLSARPEEMREVPPEVRMLKEAIPRLSDRKQLVIRETFYEDRTHGEVGKLLGVSKERVRQIRLEAIEDLKKELA